MSTKEKIIQKFIDKLDGEEFIIPSQLIDIGLFGSQQSLRVALKKGEFQNVIKVSQNRTLIPRESVIHFIKKSLDGGH